MQDKYAIGPVTIVQLVGVNAKPRIASTHIDAAVRAADHLPPTASAAAGIGNDLQDNVSEVASIYFDIKAPQALSLTAAPMHGRISLEAGVDRPAADSGGPPQGLSQSNFDGVSNNIDLAALIASLRGTPSTTPANPPGIADNGNSPPTVEATAPVISSDAAVVGSPTVGSVGADSDEEHNFVFDGAEAFGDDKILDFEAYYADAGLTLSGPSVEASAGEFDATIDTQDYFASDHGYYFMIDAAGGVSLEPTLFGHNEFVAPQHQLSINDAIPPI